jgi:hypothetical protein
MAGGYSAAPGDSLAPIADAISRIEDRVKLLESPTGTSAANLVEQVKAALVGINDQVAAAIAANSYTKAQVDSRIANPPSSVAIAGGLSTTGGVAANGDVTAGGKVAATGNVDAGGRVFSQGAVVSPGSRATTVSVGYVAQWIDGAGVMGYVPSTRGSKKDLVEMEAAAIYAVTPYWGHYLADEPDSPLKSFVIAEEVLEAGFGPDVVPLDDDGRPFTVNYSQLVPGLLAAVHDLNARLGRLEG